MRLSRLLLMTPDPGSIGTIERDLAQTGFTIEHSLCGSACMAAAIETSPDVILVDCRQDVALGLQLCRSLRATDATSATPVILLASPHEAAFRLEALEAGADEWLTSPLSSRESMLRIQGAVRRADHSAAQHLLTYADLELDLQKYRVRRRGKIVALTTVQFNLLRHLMNHPTVVFSRTQLLESVWPEAPLDEGAVTACMVRLRRALNAGGGPDLIRSVRGVGYSLDCDDPEKARASRDPASRQ